MNLPIATPQDLENFAKTGPGYVKWEQRQPAAVSWWIAQPVAGFTALAATQQLRMKTSPFSRLPSRTLDLPTV